MTASTLSLAYSSATDTEFRTWAQAIHNAIIAAGLVQTADTGQINFATATNPASGSAGGYVVYRFNDAAQASFPVFIKLEFGQTSTHPMMWVTVGTATDGAGGITSMAGTNVSVTARTQVTSTAAGSGATPGNVFVNGDASSIVVAAFPWWNSTTSSGGYFAIERWRSPDGTADGEAVQVCVRATGSSPVYHVIYIHNSYPQPGLVTTLGPVPGFGGGFAAGAWATASLLLGTNVYLMPVVTGAKPAVGAPSKFLLAYVPADVAALSTFAMTHYGTSYNWVALGGSGNPNGFSHLGMGGNATFALALRTN